MLEDDPSAAGLRTAGVRKAKFRQSVPKYHGNGCAGCVAQDNTPSEPSPYEAHNWIRHCQHIALKGESRSNQQGTSRSNLVTNQKDTCLREEVCGLCQQRQVPRPISSLERTTHPPRNCHYWIPVFVAQVLQSGSKARAQPGQPGRLVVLTKRRATAAWVGEVVKAAVKEWHQRGGRRRDVLQLHPWAQQDLS